MGKLLAIDGLNIVRRIYEANQDPDSPEKAESAIRSALFAITKLLSVHRPTHVLPVFDHGGRSWRHDIHPGYHENHASMPVHLKDRLPDLYQDLATRGMHVVSVPGVEADDVIGTAVMRWMKEGKGEAVVASTDKDLLVLVTHGATLWDHFKGETHDRRWVEEKFGVLPEQLTDLFALMGNPAHGIPGVSKVGVKTAAKLLNSYRDLEGVMAGAGILKNTLGEKLRKERDLAFLSRQLVMLKTDVVLGITWRSIEYAGSW